MAKPSPEAEMRGSSLAEALKSRYFRRYSLAVLLLSAGRWAHEVAIWWLVYEIRGTALSVGFAIAIGAGGQAALTPLAGVLIDRVNRRMLLVGSHVVKAGTAAGLTAAVLASGIGTSLWVLYGVLAALGMLAALDRPLRKAFVRDVVSADGLEGANRLFTPLSTVGRIAGSLLAALMLTLSLVWVCFAVYSAAAVAMVLLVLGIPRSMGVMAPTQKMTTGWMLSYLRYTPAVTVPLVLLVCFSLLAWNLPVIAQSFVDSQLAAGPGVFGMLIAALSLGRFCGSVAVVWMGHTNLRTVGILLALVGLLLAPLAAVSDVYVGLAAFALAGCAFGSFYSFVNAGMQVVVDPRLQGRMTATYVATASLSRTAGALLMGWLADTLGTRATLVTAGAATVCLALAALGWLSNRSLSR